jgi:hypothetical protein
MIDRDKIPESTLNELIELFGYERAELILEQEQYDFKAIQMIIFWEGLKRRYGNIVWVYALLILIIVVILFYIN